MGRGVRRHETGTGRGRDTGGRGCGGMGTEGQHGDTGGAAWGWGGPGPAVAVVWWRGAQPVEPRPLNRAGPRRSAIIIPGEMLRIHVRPNPSLDTRPQGKRRAAHTISGGES